MAEMARAILRSLRRGFELTPSRHSESPGRANTTPSSTIIDAVSDLDVAAARYALALLPSWSLPEIATQALTRDRDSSASRALAGLVGPSMSEAGPLFERMLEELHVHLPSREDAVRFLIRHCIQELAE